RQEPGTVGEPDATAEKSDHEEQDDQRDPPALDGCNGHRHSPEVVVEPDALSDILPRSLGGAKGPARRQRLRASLTAFRSPSLQKLVRYLLDWLDADVAVKHLGPLGLELDLPLGERFLLALDLAARVGEDEVDLAVDDVNAGAVHAEGLDRVPLADLLFVV